MKKSNKLLLSLAIFSFIAILGSNLILKAEYEKFDFNDIFYGYGKTSVPPFSVVKIKGNYAGLVQVQASSDFEIRIQDASENDVGWEVKGDTLELFYHRAGNAHRFNAEYAFTFSPAAFVMAPVVRSVLVENGAGKVTGFEQGKIVTRQSGATSGILIADNIFGSLESDLSGGGLLKIESRNQIREANFVVRDSSSIDLEKDIISSLNINADSLASVKIPGVLFDRILVSKPIDEQ